MHSYKSNFFIILFTTVIFISVFCLFSNTCQASFIGLTAKGLPGAGLNSGLVGWWTMDGKDNVNGALMDRSGNGNNGNPSGIATSTFYVSGKIGQAGNFDGVDDYVAVPSLPIMATMSISLWVQRTGGFGSINQERLIMNNTLSSGGFGLYIQDDNRVEFGQPGINGSRATGGEITDTKWHHIVAVYDGGTVSFFIDGVAQGSPGYTGSISADTYSLGRASYGGFLHAKLDDVRIYNKTISTTTVSELYNLGATKLGVSVPTAKPTTGLWSGLVGYWTFDGKDMVNGVAIDKSGNGNNGNPSGIATSTFYVSGKMGQAGNFDGVNDFIIGNTSPFGYPDTTFTVSAWFKTYTNGTTAIISEGGNSNAGWVLTTLGGVLNVILKNNVGGTVFSAVTSTTYGDGKWHHVVATITTNTTNYLLNDTTIYVDGVSKTLTKTPTNTTNYSDSADVWTIGARNAGASLFWKDVIDDVRIYNRALSTTTVSELYNLGATKLGVSVPTAKPTTGLWSGLAGYWTFDGKDTIWTSSIAATTKDKSTKGNTGTLNGMVQAISPVSGKTGQALKFNGTGSYIDLGSAAIINDAGAVSVSEWIKPASITSSDYMSIFKFKGVSEFTFNIGRIGNANIVGHAMFICFRGQNYMYTDSSNLYINNMLNKWHHIVLVYDGVSKGVASSYKLYFDGVSIALTAATACGGATNVNQIGTDNGSGGFYNGAIDDLRVYNRILSASEVLQLYNIGR